MTRTRNRWTFWCKSAALPLAFLFMGAAWFGHALAQRAPLTVRWGGVPAIENMMFTFIAIDRGFFEEEGVKVVGPTLGGGNTIRDAMAAGEIDFFDTGTLTYLVGKEKGLRQKIIFENFSHQIFSLFVRTELKGEVQRVRDLKGRKIAVVGPGSASWAAGLAFLRKDGLTQKDVQFVFLATDPTVWMVGFERGQIDAGVIWEPMNTSALDRRTAYPIVDISDPAVHKQQIGPRASSMVLVTTEKMIAENPEAVRRVVSALKKAAHFVHTRSAKEVAQVVAPRFKMDPALLERVLEKRKMHYSKTGGVSRSGLAVEVDLAYNAGVLQRRLSFEEMVDSKFSGVEP
jgi:NitT/TauT family transport system substrate-binding protein